MARDSDEPSLRTSGLALLALISASPEATGWGAPASSQPTSGALHVWESLPLNPCKQDLALPDPRVPAGGPPSLAARLSVVSQYFQVGSTSACPLPYAVYFLELTW